MIIRFLKKNLPCPGCGRIYTNHDVDILELHDDMCAMLLGCEKCGTEVEVEIAMKDGEVHPEINIISETPVTQDDVEKVSKVLSAHKGSLEKLLKDLGEE